uniref:Phosphatase, orphan 2 n=1 Tax=Lepisosteus oculatus TaxID=7918 RepID=W5NMS4_LEPOC|nr:PREDICTED: pyridoxal phosphate phosphatase PHOSPHO2 [Lepisosteus oculatus]
MKALVVFDFDHTVVDDNSDTWVVRCVPEQRLPDWLVKTYQKGRWTEYMGRVLSYIGDLGVSEAEMRSLMETIPFTHGMMEVLSFVAQNKDAIDCIIISDSNTVFIDWILRASNVQGAVDRVFTNPAWFDERGRLAVRCFHSHGCAHCPVNLCKRKALEDFLASQLREGVRYRRTVYAGDGGNDLCPAKSLTEGDTVMPRKGYTLDKQLAANARTPSVLKARVVVWSSGLDILKEISSSVK